MDRPWIAANQQARERLYAVLGTLDVHDLTQPLDDRWRMATAFAHLAFWDRRATLLLQHWQQGRIPPADEAHWYGDDLLNDGLMDEWNALPVSEAVRLAVEAASAVDQTVRDLDDVTAQAILARGEEWLLYRGRHRGEHLDAVERASAARPDEG
jgi:hypothetical protein